MQLQGIINGKSIELEHETELPSGSRVTVTLEPKPLSLEEKRRLVHLLCGSWAGNPSLKPIFDEIEAQRTENTVRKVSFHAPS